MPAILRRRKLISIKPERKNAVTYHKEEVQAEVMTPPPAADQQKIPGSTVVCPACKREVNKAEVEKNKYVCYECGSYFRVRTKNRIRMVADAGTFEPWFEYLESENPLDFPEYTQKVEAAREKTGLHEAVTIGRCKIYGEETVLGICDARFLMSSMGHVVGEKIALGVERATDLKLPVILFCCSGGARMQEGIISLMQMAQTSAALKRHSDAGLLYVPVLTDPTTGGVTASFAMLGDIILAEPGALIGFAGPRVIEQTIGQKLPEGFQRAEFQLEHGFVDAIVERKNLKITLNRILKMHHSREGFADFDPLRMDDNTKINYPILQNEKDDYYLEHCINLKKGLPGCIYTNSCSQKDFSSWNTVIYGHNMKNGTMFGSLKIEKDFFDSLSTVTIFTRDQKLFYQVFAIVEFSDVYIPDTYNEENISDREKYILDIRKAAEENGYIRADINITADTPIITLSTCIRGKENKRLLVVAVQQ